MINLNEWAEQIHRIWKCPIYLCGSAIWQPEPRDIDIRVELPDPEFERIVGPIEQWEREIETGRWTKLAHRWSSMCLPFSHDGAYKTGLNIDFQFYPASYCEAKYANERKKNLIEENVR